MSDALPAPHPARDLPFGGLASKVIRSPFQSDEFFGTQPASRSTLPSPQPLLENLTRCVIEILAGARDLEQISRWVTDDVYRHLLKQKCGVGRYTICPVERRKAVKSQSESPRQRTPRQG
jgi:hypothetical protein